MTLFIEYVADMEKLPEIDSKIRTIVGSFLEQTGSGFFFPTFTRDMQFKVDDVNMAKMMIERLKNHPELNGVTSLKAWLGD